MKFYDKVEIMVKSGKGGDGCVSAKKETGTAFGGPAGGDGGKGGDVVFIASKDILTLQDFKYNSKYIADKGEPGRSKDQYGANAEDLIIKVPVGTIVKDKTTDKILYYFEQDGQKHIVANGGQGGVGNIHFKNSIRQFPNFSLKGEPGVMKDFVLELQLLADIGLIGQPSVGKSTLINAISSAKAQVAEYHFTTIVPNLGVVQDGKQGFTVIDIPGLIQGASDGKGLGNEFLRHILKCKIFSFLIDGSHYEKGVKELFDIVDEVLKYIKKVFIGSIAFGPEIKDIECKFVLNNYPILQVRTKNEFSQKNLFFEKIINIVISKYDLVQDEEIIMEFKKFVGKEFAKYMSFDDSKSKEITDHIFVLSGATHEGIKDWKYHCFSSLKKNIKLINYQEFTQIENENKKDGIIEDETETKFDRMIEKGYLDENTSKNICIRKIIDKEFCRLVFMTPWGNGEAELWFWNTVNKTGFLKSLHKKGARFGDVLHIVSLYEGENDKYIEFEG